MANNNTNKNLPRLGEPALGWPTSPNTQNQRPHSAGAAIPAKENLSPSFASTISNDPIGNIHINAIPRRGSLFHEKGCGDPSRGGHEKKTLVLCFDGTGNKFKGTSGDTNILKIFSMLDRRKGDQYHYYQPGIGTYLTSHAITHRAGKGMSSRFKSAYQKAVDAAVGKSFDHHVMGGYRFLMRYYHPGDDIYMFGFSRGAYTARFLCEMLDHVGLVVQGNEEMVHFAWKTFSEWQLRAHDDSEKGKQKKQEMYNYMKAFRETFARPVKRVRFLGLFDTVNSVPRFEKAWLKRASRFTYTARSTARVIRHAVGLDERRAKFRQDLVEKIDFDEIHDTLGRGLKEKKSRQRSWREKEVRNGVTSGLVTAPIEALNGKLGGLPPGNPPKPRRKSTPPDSSLLRMSLMGGGGGPATSLVSLNIHFDREDGDDDDTEQDIEELWFPGAHGDIGGGWDIADGEYSLAYGPLVWMVREARRAGLAFDERRLQELGCLTDLGAIYEGGEETTDDANPQIELSKATPTGSPISPEDIEKSGLFPLGILNESSDVTNGNGVGHKETNGVGPTPDSNDNQGYGYCYSSVLHSMPNGANGISNGVTNGVTNGVANGLTNGVAKGGVPVDRAPPPSSPHPITDKPFTDPNSRILIPSGTKRSEIDSETEERLRKSLVAKIHCCLTFGGGLPHVSTLGWRMMEYLPFRRMDLQPDGSWKAIAWPLPRGEVRDVPEDAKIHCSVLERMKADKTYRPGNLLVGGGGRGVRIAPPEYGIGEWITLRERGSLVGEVLIKKNSGQRASQK